LSCNIPACAAAAAVEPAVEDVIAAVSIPRVLAVAKVFAVAGIAALDDVSTVVDVLSVTVV
jgi:hypothetical protein